MSIERVVPPPLGPDNEVYREHLARYEFALLFAKGKKILDVACGSGFGSDLISEAASEVIGLDRSQDAIEFAKAHFSGGNLSYTVGGATALPFGDGDFEAVISFETIEHFAEQDKFLREVARVLKPNGTFIVSTPDREVIPLFLVNPNEYINPFHVKELSKREFTDLLRKYFSDIKLYGQGLYQPKSDSARGMLRLVKRFFTWLPEELRLKLKSRLIGAGRTDQVFELQNQRSKYLIAVCRI